jgi:hypothetical protein
VAAVVLRVVGGAPIDALGWGDATNTFVEGIAAVAPAAGSSLERRPGGIDGNTTDTNDNGADFFVQATPNPQNLAAPPVPARSDLPRPRRRRRRRRPRPTRPHRALGSGLGLATLVANAGSRLTGAVTGAVADARPDADCDATRRARRRAQRRLRRRRRAPAEPNPDPKPLAVTGAYGIADAPPDRRAEARRRRRCDPEARSLPDGSIAVIVGTLTDLGALESGRSGFVQDATGGIAVYLDVAFATSRPARASVSRNARRAVWRADAAGGRDQRRGPRPDLLPDPDDVATGPSSRSSRGTRVTVTGTTIGSGQHADGLGILLDDGSGSVRVIVGPDALAGTTLPSARWSGHRACRPA